MRHTVLVLSLAAAPFAAAADPARPMSPQEVPAALSPAVSKGEAAMDALREKLFARLNELILQGGPVAAIQVCRSDAPRIAKEVGEAHRVELGRTSFRLRNTANAPRPWAAPYVAAAAGKKGGDVKPVVVDLGDRLGLLRPITVMPACTRCHGAVDGIDPEVKAELARGYPKDQATGFAPGDHRGFVWAEVKKR
ncbi:MAG TPA: DUF3365 domain-containing protein [Anaeromyxobacter sp.]|nr:DUF3365 domain-containing protein [Anaeromyxobacter sp.]